MPAILLPRLLTPILRGLAAALLVAASLPAVEFEPKPAGDALAKFDAVQAPKPGPLVLEKGDRLAIVGDSITEQKMYSRIIETYLTACTPELAITARQYGWSGETAEGFSHRQESDCLRFKPTIATLCYGMNDFRYVPHDDKILAAYVQHYGDVVRAFTKAGVRVILGSPGCVGKVPGWVKTANGTVDDLNVSLLGLRNADVALAAQEGARFADVFWPMLTSSYAAHGKYGAGYNVAGGDGVHPNWAGHVVMAYAYLRAMGLSGDIGTITWDLGAGKATATAGHTVDSASTGELHLTSTRYPFCATGAPDQDGSIRSGMTLVPFNHDLNRLLLVAKGGSAKAYAVTWGTETHDYSAEQLAKGVNLADDFAANPFSAAFARVDDAVRAKQEYETKQVKGVFHGEEGKKDIGSAVTRTEAERAPLAAAVAAAVVPVSHVLTIVAK
jgi:lysophospholipase L1-like esterase